MHLRLRAGSGIGPLTPGPRDAAGVRWYARRVTPARLLPALGLALACGTSREDWPGDRPRLDDVRFLGQSPQEPFALAFELAFADAGGAGGPDLAGGRLRVDLDGAPAAEAALGDLFARQSPPLPPTATEGQLEVVVRLERETVDLEAPLEVGFVLEDAEGEVSNRPVVTVRAIPAGGGE